MNQTAVQWLEQEFLKLESTIGVHGIMYELIEQAKMMEKEQIESAHMNGQSEWDCGVMREEIIELSKQYYNETYGKEEK